PADCGSDLFLRGDAGECAGVADEKGSGASRSDDEEVSGVPERDSDRCATVRALFAASGKGGGVGLQLSAISRQEEQDLFTTEGQRYAEERRSLDWPSRARRWRSG